MFYIYLAVGSQRELIQLQEGGWHHIVSKSLTHFGLHLVDGDFPVSSVESAKVLGAVDSLHHHNHLFHSLNLSCGSLHLAEFDTQSA